MCRIGDVDLELALACRVRDLAFLISACPESQTPVGLVYPKQSDTDTARLPPLWALWRCRVMPIGNTHVQPATNETKRDLETSSRGGS